MIRQTVPFFGVSSSQFDTEIVDDFFSIHDLIKSIKARYPDEGI